MRKKKEPTAAPGNDDALLEPATKEDKRKGNVTKVTVASFDHE